MSKQQQRHLLIVGASGVIGSGAVKHFSGRPGWQVTAVSRRRPIVGDDSVFTHVVVDLSDRDACAAAVAKMPPVTEMIYAAVAETPGLVAGWFDTELMEANGRMFANILDPVAAGGSLRHLSLLQGVKAYGALHHPIEVPAREDRPRDDHANFYWLHEDHARLRASEAGFALTIFRPPVLLGSAPGAAMNPVAAIGAYAALCRELGRPLAYFGDADSLLEVIDTGLLAEGFEWAAISPAAVNQIFNITNGDLLAIGHAWPEIASSLGLSSEGEPPPNLVDFFAQEDSQAAWGRLVARHGLRVPTLSALLGQSHHYADLLFGARVAKRSMPTLLSTVKIRQAGFGACRDSVASLRYWLRRMVDLRLLPPFGEHT